MAVIQTLLNGATSLTIDKRKPSAVTISRGQHLKTQSRAPMVYKFVVALNPGLRYDLDGNRGLLEEYDVTGRTTEEQVSLSNVTGSAYLMDYQGGLTASDAGNLTMTALTVAGDDRIVVSVTGTTSASAGTVLVEKGDYIQPINSRYPYQATQKVLHGSGTTANIPVSRAIINETGYTYTGNAVVLGNDCKFTVKMIEQPTYGIIPGRYIQWNGDMALMEVLA
tara:strand:+ start:148 stop:816 length:669 start_codon:yes stop_codon:yes gene_type:complete